MKSVIPQFAKEPYYQHEQSGDPLHGRELHEAEHEAKEAFAKIYPAAALYKEVTTYLDSNKTRASSHADPRGGDMHIMATSKAPKRIAAKYPEHLWIKSSLFEHQDSYLGVGLHSTDLPVFVNFHEKTEVPVGPDLPRYTKSFRDVMVHINQD